MGYLLSLETITKAAKELRRNNKIVFTHGAYDLFHIGQSEFLRKSKEKGQILIVGIDSDELVSMYKGIVRPVIPLEQRLNIISKLQYVDFVFPLIYLPGLGKEITIKKPSSYHLRLYKELNPDTITYGRKYGGTETIKRARKYFKHLIFRKIVHEYDKLQSTTKIIDKILNSNGEKVLN